jgi:DNA-binding transcriptional ArsR family regulator
MTTFTARRQDLGTIRFARSPTWETMGAVRLLIDPRGRLYHQAWHAAVGQAARQALEPLLAVSPLKGWVPDFLSPPPAVPAPSLGAQLDQIRATPAGHVAADLARCHGTLTGKAREIVGAMLPDPEAARDSLASLIEVAWGDLVRPFWPEIEALLDADVAYRSRQLADRGLRPMLEGINPVITWREHGVHLDDKRGDVVDLAGRGLLLMPSAFSWPLVIAISGQPWQPTIAYPARGIAGLWQRPAAPPDALVRLLGATRATILAGLEQPVSTTALAQRHGLSPSGASRHLIALRDAGLVRGDRHGHEVRYARTRLGTELTRAASG